MQLVGAFLLIAAYFGYSLTNLCMYFVTEKEMPIVLCLAIVNATIVLILLARARFQKKPIMRPKHMGLIFSRAFTGVLFSLCYFAALSYASFAEVGMLTNSFPLFIVLIAWLFLGERVSVVQWIALLVGMVGVWFILSPNVINFMSGGMIFATLASIFWAVSLIIMQKVADHEEVYTYLFYFYLFSLLLLLPFALQSIRWITLSQIVLSVLAGVLSLVSQGLLFKAYKVCSAAELAPYNFSFAFFHFVLARGLFAFAPSKHFFIGSALIFLGGVINLVIFERKPKERPSFSQEDRLSGE
ncbi:DMT family transporter [bacterium]|nr:DMT family transporter [bacterium]